MTTKTIHYDTEPQMKAGKTREANNGFRALHTNFTNNHPDHADGYEIFYDNAPSPPPIPPTNMTQRQFVDELAAERNIRIT